MQFNYLRLASSGGNVDLPIQSAAWDDQFVMKGADGLGPPDIDIAIARVPGQGGYFQNKDPQNKQIIVRVGLNPDWGSGGTPQALRETLYGLISGGYTGDQIACILMVDPSTEAARIYGYVSKMEIVPFSKDPQVQITIECLSPYFEALTDTVVSLTGMSNTAPVIPNAGSAPTGFLLHFTVVTPVSGAWKIADASATRFINIVGPPWAVGDTVIIDTRAGSRNALFTHSGVDTSLLGYISEDSDWLQLHPGNNTFTITGQNRTWTLWQYKAHYWGV